MHSRPSSRLPHRHGRRTSRPAQPSCAQFLEARTLLSGPSAREQQMLELINRMRTNPAAEVSLLLHSGSSQVADALTVFDVDRAALANQWSKLSPVAPVAWNSKLSLAAMDHNQQMSSFDTQSHRLPGEKSLGARILDAGYDYASAGENVFAYAKSVLHCHAGFAIDWGDGLGGMQDPPGHRENLMNPAFREVGVSIIDAEPGKSTGPLLVTQDFAEPASPRPYVLGVVYRDTDGDRSYSIGEGLEGVRVQVAGRGQVYSATSMTAGGYQLNVPAGTYSVRFSGGGLPGVITRVVTVGGDNVKLDYRDPGPSQTTLASGAGASAIAYAPSGKLYLAYYDAAQSRLRFVRRSLQNAWSAPVTIDDSADVGSSLSLAVNPAGQPAVAYYDATSGDLRYAIYNGTRWITRRVDSAGDVGLNPSLAFDDTGAPAISYYDRTHRDLRFAGWTGTRWNITTIESTGDAGRYSSVQYDASRWHVAYASDSSHQVRFASSADHGWDVTAVGRSAGASRYLSLAFGSSGDPTLGYFDVGAAALKAATFHAGWSVRTVTTGPGLFGQVAYDPATGFPSLVYYHRPDDGVERATLVNGVWSTTRIGALSAGGLSSALASDARLCFATTDRNGMLRAYEL